MKEYLTVTLIGEMLQENVSGQCFSDFSSIIVVDPLQPNIYIFSYNPTLQPSNRMAGHITLTMCSKS